MSLDDLLKKAKQAAEEENNKMKAALEAKQEKAKKFEEAIQPCFNGVIIPTVNQIVQTFKTNGFNANLGQDVEAISYGGKTVSLTARFNNCIMQIDFVANKLSNSVSFNARFVAKHKLDNQSDFKIEEVTAEEIHLFVEANVKIMSLHCK